MPTMDVVIPGQASTVTGAAHGAVDPLRFVDLAFQVGGFVLDDGGRRVTSLRWIPVHPPPYTQITSSEGGDRIFCTPSARSLSFILPRITGALSVLLLISGDTQHQRRYDLGDYTLVDPNAEHPDTKMPTLLFQRVVPHTPAKAVVTEAAAAATTEAPVLPLPHEITPVLASSSDGDDASMDARCRRLFTLWGIDVSYDGVVFSLTGDDPPFRPMAMLFDVLDSAVFAWCGTANRFGRSVLCTMEPVYPTPARFAHIRSVARTLRFPVLLGHGSPSSKQEGGGDAVVRLQWIVLRPGDGAAQHVHFQWDAVLIRMVIVSGGDADDVRGCRE